MARQKTKTKKEIEAETLAFRGDFEKGRINPFLFKTRITVTDIMLGTAPNDTELYTNFLASKAADPKQAEEEEAWMVAIDRYDAKGITIFRRNDNGDIILPGYMLKGYFKNAAKALKDVPGTISSEVFKKSYKPQIDNLIFTAPKYIKLRGFDKDKIDLFNRPLRISGKTGDRTAIACSEEIPEGSYLEVCFECLTEEMLGVIPELLDYGAFNGIGQWHNSGKGAFLWEHLDDNGNTIEGGNKSWYDAIYEAATKGIAV